MKEINAVEFRNKILENKKIIIKFSSQYCTNCIELNATLEPLILKHPEMEFYEFDARENLPISDEMHVEETPTIVAYNKGKEISRWLMENGDLAGWLNMLNW